MSDFVIRAASFIGMEGHGNDCTGFRPWPAPVADALQRGELEALRWGTLSVTFNNSTLNASLEPAFVSHHFSHIPRNAASKCCANPSASKIGEASTCCRNPARNAARLCRSLACKTARAT